MLKYHFLSQILEHFYLGISDEHLDEMVYDNDKKCELLNKYFSLVSKLEEENIPVPPFESKTNDSITDIFLFLTR
jgi:hypothetical protein